MGQLASLYQWHRNQIGTKEDPKGSNNVIYNTMYYNRVISDSRYYWCLVYQWAGFHENGMDNLFYGGKKTASCTTFMNWAKSIGKWVTEGYKLGDLAFFNFDNNPRDSEHVGFVVGYSSNGKVHTIEGNHNDQVADVFRDPSTIIGAYRPNYDDAPFNDISVPTPEPPKPIIDKAAVSLPIIRYGDKNDAVKMMQQILIAKGYSVGPDRDDGDFGLNTKLGLRQYQRDKGLMVDGICGPETHASFWEV